MSRKSRRRMDAGRARIREIRTEIGGLSQRAPRDLSAAAPDLGQRMQAAAARAMVLRLLSTDSEQEQEEPDGTGHIRHPRG